MRAKDPETFENVVLGVLHKEFDAAKHAETDERIKNLLARKNVGPYDPDRVALLRRFKDEIQALLGLKPLPQAAEFEKSRYFVARHGKYGDYSDFDIPRLTKDLALRYPEISVETVTWFVRYAVGTYYLL